MIIKLPHLNHGFDQQCVDQSQWTAFLSQRMENLLKVAGLITKRKNIYDLLTRPLVGHIQSEAAMIEELLDAYGANTSENWHIMRRLISKIRLIAEAEYGILHICHTLKHYKLLALPEDFTRSTRLVAVYTGILLTRFCEWLIQESISRRINIPAPSGSELELREIMPLGVLPRARARRLAQNSGESICKIASAYMSLFTVDTTILRWPINKKRHLYNSAIPDKINPESLTSVVYRFRYLRDLYDRELANTDQEASDPDVALLRGHAALILHLSEVGLHFSILLQNLHDAGSLPPFRGVSIINSEQIVDILVGYALFFAGRFLETAKPLCQRMLRRYATMGAIDLPIPAYRGFHVRPSTLVATIIRYYGSEVKMSFNNQYYNASSSMDVFRVNENINALKRARFKDLLAGKYKDEVDSLQHLTPKTALLSLLTVMDKNKDVKILKVDLPLQDRSLNSGESFVNYAQEQIANLFFHSAIDIPTDVKVRFEGDERVLNDLKILADNGYGETSEGKDIPLPAQLPYLCKYRQLN